VTPGVELKVFVLTDTMPLRRDWEVRPDEKFDVDVIGAVKQRVAAKVGGQAGRNIRLLSPRLTSRIGAWKPDALICTSISEFLMLLPLRLLRRFPIGALVADTSFTASCYGSLHQGLRAFLYRRMDFYVAYGTETTKYLTSIGIAQHKVKHAKWSVDNSLYNPEEALKRYDDGARRRWISVGALIPGKGFLQLLEAWCSQSPEFVASNQLVIVGEGPEETPLRNFIAANMPLESAIITGYRSPEVLPSLYLESDVFIFPTLTDTWGLVVNEAMASGLPIVCSKYAGCHSDLVQKSNGIIIDPVEPEALASAINEFWGQRNDWPQMGEMSKQIVSAFTLEATASAIIEAAQHALKPGGDED